MSMTDADFVKESDGEKDMFKLANETYADYKDRFVPLENELINNLSNVQEQKPQMSGRAAAEVRQSFDKNYDTISTQNTMRGADPSSGAATMGLGNAAVEEAKIQTRATTSADQSVDDSYYAGQRQIMNMGQGIRSGATGLEGVHAGIDANQTNIQAQSDAYGKNAMIGAVGTVGGSAFRKWGLPDNKEDTTTGTPV